MGNKPTAFACLRMVPSKRRGPSVLNACMVRARHRRWTGMNEDLLVVEELRAGFETADGFVRAVDGVSFSLRKGEVLGLVGESGCGKTVTALSLLRLLPRPPAVIESGRVLFRGRDLLAMPIEELRGIRGARISVVFQGWVTSSGTW